MLFLLEMFTVSIVRKKYKRKSTRYLYTEYIDFIVDFIIDIVYIYRSQWPRCLKCGSAAVCLLGLRVRIPPEAWMPVSFESCLLSGRGLCVGLITRAEEFYRVWCVSEYDHETSKMRKPWPNRVRCTNRWGGGGKYDYL
jgi:hypothetical protein